MQPYLANVEYNVEVTSYQETGGTWHYRVTVNGVEKLARTHTQTTEAAGGLKISVGQCHDGVISDLEYTF